MGYGVNCQLRYWGRVLLILRVKFPTAGTCHLGLISKALPGNFTHYSACVGFCTSSPNQGIIFGIAGRWAPEIFLECQMSIQGIEYVLTVICLLLVAENFWRYIWLISLVLRNLALLVATFQICVMRTKFDIYVYIFISCR